MTTVNRETVRTAGVVATAARVRADWQPSPRDPDPVGRGRTTCRTSCGRPIGGSERAGRVRR